MGRHNVLGLAQPQSSRVRETCEANPNIEIRNKSARQNVKTLPEKQHVDRE
jgi:hypothetical protein